jgi:hypothetical protein
MILFQALKSRCAFARCTHTLARRIVALADQSSLYQGFTRSLVPSRKRTLEE